MELALVFFVYLLSQKTGHEDHEGSLKTRMAVWISDETIKWVNFKSIHL